ncbi:hypothetical protein Syun_005109 [Stephania yunnanensis]|uniref:Uncharacterized protein n=1 Tax=Stephania yunnanensis TaxID=152371 RepID=A0AAP0L5N8_9MAGN
MEVDRVLHMNEGEGDASYASNSSLQRAVLTKVKSILEETVLDLVGDETFLETEVLCIADLGCSSGPNSLSVISHIVDTITAACQRRHRRPPEFQVVLNDLPGNDFNTIFKSLPSFYDKLKRGNINHGPCFVAGVPGSFYGRLFPRKSIHFIHSSYSLHYLSQIPKDLVSEEGAPLNKGNTYIASTTPPAVSRAYYEQFKQDFNSFLSLRSDEVIAGGRAVLTFMGTHRRGRNRLFNFPYYAPSAAEVRDIILEEGSFNLTRLEGFEIGWDPNPASNSNRTSSDNLKRATYVSKSVRAVAEPMLTSHFGGSQIMDALFQKHTERIAELYSKEEPKYYPLVITLMKK